MHNEQHRLGRRHMYSPGAIDTYRALESRSMLITARQCAFLGKTMDKSPDQSSHLHTLPKSATFPSLRLPKQLGFAYKDHTLPRLLQGQKGHAVNMTSCSLHYVQPLPCSQTVTKARIRDQRKGPTSHLTDILAGGVKLNQGDDHLRCLPTSWAPSDSLR